MLIDWFTVGAQALNFLILVWLLKRFLYKPMLHAIDAREKRIAAELADAAAKKAEAQKERDEFQRKNEEFDQQRAALLEQGDGRGEGGASAAARRGAQGGRRLERASDRRRCGTTPRTQSGDRAPDPAGGVCHRAKGAGGSRHASLEERIGEVFTRRLREMDGHGEGRPRHGPRDRVRPRASCAARSSCPPEQRAAIQTCAQRDILGATSASASRPRPTWSAASS